MYGGMGGQTPWKGETATAAIRRLYRKNPIGCPVFMIAVGAIFIVLIPIGAVNIADFALAVFPGIIVVAGLILLPRGIERSRRKKAGLERTTCPHCHRTLLEFPSGFIIEEFDGAHFSFITCKNCHGQFTVDMDGVVDQVLPPPAKG